jgi:hypothetical protein
MYIVNSPRVGTVGEPYDPAGQDVGYLLAAGFIVQKSHTKATKSAKTDEVETSEKESHGN